RASRRGPAPAAPEGGAAPRTARRAEVDSRRRARARDHPQRPARKGQRVRARGRPPRPPRLRGSVPLPAGFPVPPAGRSPARPRRRGGVPQVEADPRSGVAHRGRGAVPPPLRPVPPPLAVQPQGGAQTVVSTPRSVPGPDRMASPAPHGPSPDLSIVVPVFN